MISILYFDNESYHCKGHLYVFIHNPDKCNIGYDFGCNSLKSGGTHIIDENYDEWTTEGPWEVINYPPNFPYHLKSELEKIINKEIPYGCCGSCYTE